MSAALSKSDPNVTIPPAVQALAAQAAARQEAFIAEMSGQQGDEGDPSPPPAPPLQNPPKDPPPAPPPAPPQQQAGEEESFRQKFLSAQGRLEKAQQANAQMADQIAQMQRAITTLQTQQQPAGEGTQKQYKKLITEQEEEEFGTEFLDVVGRRAQEEFERQSTKYEQELDELRRQVKGVNTHVAQSAYEQMLQYMDRELPDWREINYTEGFKAWLALPDPYSRGIRQKMLEAAFAANDAPLVRTFFQGFLAEEAATAPSGSQPSQRPAATAAGKVPLESLAAPGRAKTAAANNAPTEKPFFTRAEVTQFYVDVANGRWRGREAERVQRDRQIMEAGAEGRIR